MNPGNASGADIARRVDMRPISESWPDLVIFIGGVLLAGFEAMIGLLGRPSFDPVVLAAGILIALQSATILGWTK